MTTCVWRTHECVMPKKVGWTPWSAADPPVGLSGLLMKRILLGEERVQGDPRGPGGPPNF